jgi:hypothetical protein
MFRRREWRQNDCRKICIGGCEMEEDTVVNV